MPRLHETSATMLIQSKLNCILVCNQMCEFNDPGHDKHHQMVGNGDDMMKYESVTVARGHSPDRLALWRCHDFLSPIFLQPHEIY